ncbi:MAG: DUF1573 domain-containing protein [Alistipes sp.]|nr:DUF1573 domain-containing protein [Alistipes sp.]
MRYALLLILSLAWGCSAAQLRLVPKATLDSLASPRTVATDIVVGQSTVELGRVAESDIATAEIALHNSGKSPATYRTRTTCRCLTATSGVLKAGERGVIRLSFVGKGYPGPFSHKLFVYADNGTIPTAVVAIKGFVVASADRRGDYPYTCGALLLRQRGVKIQSGATERIACMNGGTTELQITKDRMLSSPELEVYTEPATLKAGEQGDLVIRLRGEKRENMKLYINAQTAPSRREIIIE